jgi:hypothetical protein
MNNPYLNALSASTYIVAVASLVYFGPRLVEVQEPSVLIPITMLSLLVLSVATMAYLFFYQPIRLHMEGRTPEGGAFFLKTVGAFALITLVLLVLLYAFSREAAPSGRTMSIESYVSQNISELSPEKAVLGGTFYVTEVSAADGAGVVHFEDGHIALVADFTYTISDTQGIDITSFTVRK